PQGSPADRVPAARTARRRPESATGRARPAPAPRRPRPPRPGRRRCLPPGGRLSLHHQPEGLRRDQPVALQHQGADLAPVADALHVHADPPVLAHVGRPGEAGVLDGGVGVLPLELEAAALRPPVIPEPGEDLPPHPEVRLPPGHGLGRLGQAEADAAHLVQRARSSHWSSSLIVPMLDGPPPEPLPGGRTRTAIRSGAPAEHAPHGTPVGGLAARSGPARRASRLTGAGWWSARRARSAPPRPPRSFRRGDAWSATSACARGARAR